jgi:hypothetical protein
MLRLVELDHQERSGPCSVITSAQAEPSAESNYLSNRLGRPRARPEIGVLADDHPRADRERVWFVRRVEEEQHAAIMTQPAGPPIQGRA